MLPGETSPEVRPNRAIPTFSCAKAGANHSSAIAALSPAADAGADEISPPEDAGLLALKETTMFVRLKIEDTRAGMVATISQRDDDGKITGRPSIFLVGDKEEAKQKAKAAARALGLKTYGVVDRTCTRTPSPIRPA